MSDPFPFAGLPKERPSTGWTSVSERPPSFDWHKLINPYIHPVKVEILEALNWIQEPLSAGELTRILSDRALGVVAFHLTSLADRKVVGRVFERQARGARETYYYFRAT